MATTFNSPKDFHTAKGKYLGFSDWHTIDQQQINTFAELTNDHHWIHVDEERAKHGPFGKCIAHGFFSLSLISTFLSQILVVENFSMGLNYGCNKVRFISPVPVGSRIRGGAKLLEVEKINDGYQIVTLITIEIEHQEKPACIAESIGRFYC